ncbi:MAG: hypothetical protein B5M53_10630 [Candidatus Cloacimonas sp. 4484_209]|nr:MAG: hypothetical protein B5M53_10630 [Candidatus Cloacimonas sp. 4484_209]
MIKILAEADLPGSSVSQVARKYNIPSNTIYRWRQKYKSLSSEAKRLKVLEEENLKLKKLLAEKGLRIQIFTEALKKASNKGATYELS